MTSQTIIPYPFQVSSEHQMYGEQMHALDSKIKEFTYDNVQAIIKGITAGGASIKFTKKYDVYIRDEVRQPGTLLGGKHGGEPLNNPAVALNNTPSTALIASILKAGTASGGDGGAPGCGAAGGPGGGSIPILSNQSDFAEKMPPLPVVPPATTPPPTYDTYSAGTGVRPTYTTNGTDIDIRFRRELEVSKSFYSYYSYYLLSDTGYLAEEF